MLVSIEADAVAEPVREKFVVGTVTTTGDDRTCRIIHTAGYAAGVSSVERRVLCLAHKFERASDFLTRLAEDAGARHVRLVAIHSTAAVDQDNIAFLQLLRLNGAVRERRRGAE